MADLSTIIDYCISVGNKSGSIPPAPIGLKHLKESINGLPFELLTPSMSGIFNNLLGALGQLSQMMGGLQNLGGEFQTILGQIQSGNISQDQIISAFGGVTAMTAGLSQYLSSSDLQSIMNVLPQEIQKVLITGGRT
jgi:hypothetical protein